MSIAGERQSPGSSTRLPHWQRSRWPIRARARTTVEVTLEGKGSYRNEQIGGLTSKLPRHGAAIGKAGSPRGVMLYGNVTRMTDTIGAVTASSGDLQSWPARRAIFCSNETIFFREGICGDPGPIRSRTC